MDKLVLIVIIAAVIAVSMSLIYVVMIQWNGFMSVVLGLPEISFIQAMQLVLLVTYIAVPPIFIAKAL